MRFFILSVSAAFSYGGWYLAQPWGMGWAFVVSGLGALIGVYAGWKLGQRWLR